MLRRYVVALLIMSLLFDVLPDVVLPGASRVQAASITEVIIRNFIGRNLNRAANYEMINDELIEEAIRAVHEQDQLWGDVRMQAVLDYLGEQIADTVSVNGASIRKNPWSENSVSSDGSPYYPGIDFNDLAMNTEYTLGQLIVDYVQSVEVLATNYSSEEIRTMYDQLAEGEDGEEGNPFIDYEALVALMQSNANAGRMGSYADKKGNEAIDYQKLGMITYREFLANRQAPLDGGYLFIGTWIINAQNLNATFYRMAVQSMSDYDQQIMLYKSELAGNKWKDISGATGLQYILPIAETVEESELTDPVYPKWVSVFVDETGLPRKAASVKAGQAGEEEDIFNIINPYDIEYLPELKSLKMQYDAGVVSATEGGVNSYIHARISEVFNRDSHLDRNADMDRDCKYFLEISGQTGIAFYAADPFLCNSNTVFLEKINGLFGLSNAVNWRYEESGAGFLESMERAVDYYNEGRRGNEGKFNYRFGAYDSANYPQAYWDQQERLIRGTVSWTNERKWRDDTEAEGFGGIDGLRSRIWNFQDMWAEFSCVMDETTDDLDQKLTGVKGLYSALRATGTSEDKELADEALLIAEKVDAARRARAYYNLVENEEHNYVVGPVLNLLYQWVTSGQSHVGGSYKLRLHTSESFAPIDGITQAVESAITGCQDAYVKYSGMALTQSKTIAGQLEYDLSNYVIDNAAGGLAGVRAQLRDLVDLENINNSVVAHKSRELNFINEVLPVADSKFQQVLHASAGQDYATAVADPATTKSTLEEILNDQKADVGAVASELQRFIKARSLRLPTEDAIRFINERINWAEDQRAGISVDAFGPYAAEALDDHINWLKDLLSSVKQGGEITDEAGELEMKKAELAAQYLDALDENNLKEAEELGRKIEEVQKALDEENAKKNQTAASGSSAADKINAEVSNTPRAAAEKLAEKALADIADDNLDPLPDIITTLEELGSPRLEDIYEALVTHGAPNKLIHQAEEAIKNISGSPFADEYPELQQDSDGGNGGIGDGDNGNGSGEGPGNGGGNGDTDTGNADGNGDNGNGNGPGTGGNDNGTGTDHDNGNGNGQNGGTGGNGTGNDPGNGSGNGSGDNGGTGGNGPGNGQNGDDNNNGSGNAGGGNGTGGGGTGEGDNGRDTGEGGSGEGSSPEVPDYGPGTGLRQSDFDKAIRDTFKKDFNGLNDGEKAAVVAALNDFANAREDKAAHNYALDLLDELDLMGCPFIYRQYVSDYSREYVSLAAVDKCRRYTKFRMVQKDFKVTMSQFARGSASYVFNIGSDSVSKNNSGTESMEAVCVSQTDESIRHSKTAKYAYIPENNSGKFLYCTCAYIPGTEWAILITPQVDKKIAQLLDRLDLEADGE